MVKPASKRSAAPALRAETASAEAQGPQEVTGVEAKGLRGKRPMLVEGYAGDDVAELQTLLAKAGFDPGPIDGKFGPLTREAVVAYQRFAHLNDDGKAGARTLDSLKSAPQPSDFAASAPGPVPTAPAASRFADDGAGLASALAAPVAAAPTHKTKAKPPAPSAPAVAPPSAPPAPAVASSPAGAGEPPAGAAAAALSSVASLASSKAINPIDALKLIRNGDVDLVLPVNGEFLPGLLTAKGKSTVHLTLKVVEGNIDFPHSKITFDPPVTGPYHVSIRGVDMKEDGRAELDIKYLPNAKVGRPAPAKLSDFVDQLNSTTKLPIKMLGITVKSIDVGPNAPPVDVKNMMAHVDLANTKVSVSNVAFQNGQVPLGSLGNARLGPDSRLSIEGSLADLRIQGHASLQDLNFNAAGTMIKGGKGSGDLSVHLSTDAQFKGYVDTKISNLQIQAEYAVSRRENGDFIELARGKLQDAEVSVREPVGTSGTKPVASMRIGSFDGTVNSGRITIPDGNGTARVNLGKSEVKGTIEVNGHHVMVSGDVDIKAQIDEYDSPGTSANFKMTDAKLQGKAHATFDSALGIAVDGNLHLTGHVESGRVGTTALQSKVLSGELDATVTKFFTGNDGKLDIRGKTSVDFGFENMKLGTGAGINLSGGRGRLTGKGDLRITDQSLAIDNAKLKLTGAVEDGRLALGSNVVLDIKAGSTIESVLTHAVFGAESEFDMTGMKVDATLDGGSVSIPGAQTLHFKDGAKVKFALDQLKVPKHGLPEVSGSLELQASVGSKQIDLASVARIPGLTLSPAQGIDQTFKLKLGRFSVQRDGTFDVSNIGFGLEATVKYFGGRVAPN